MADDKPTLQIDGDNTQLQLEAGFPGFMPGELFDHFIRPELLVRWWPQEAVVDPRPGGRYRLSWPAMGWHLVGEFTRFEPGERLAYTWSWEHRPDLPARNVDILILPVDGGSKVRLTHGDYDGSQRDQADRQSHAEGWSHFFSQLQSLQERERYRR